MERRLFPSLRPPELVAFHAGKQNYRLETIGGREARREIDFSAAISDPISFTYPFSLLIRLPPLAHLLPHGTLVVVRRRRRGGGVRQAASQPLLVNASILLLCERCAAAFRQTHSFSQ